MTTTTPSRSLGDVLEDLRPQDLILSPGLAQRGADGAVLLAGPPSNQEILNAAKAFYRAHDTVVDASATNTGSVAQHQPQLVHTLNGYNWKSQQLSSDQKNTTKTALFGSSASAAAANGGGLFGPALDAVKADHLFTTIGVGISADLQFFIGGAGGLGCMWDLANREGPKGYGYVTGEYGLRITAALNVQLLITNQLPSATNFDIWGLKVSVAFGVGLDLSFQTFWYGNDMTLLGFGIGAGVGIGGGATVFGGHIWNFG